MHSQRIIAASIVFALSAVVLPQTSLAADAAPPKQVTAQDLAKTPPSATFEAEGTQVRLLVGGSSAKGVLTFQGKAYPFTSKGVSLGGVGVAEVSIKGDVHYLNRVEDFAGTYTGVGMGATLVKGKGASTFQNSKGVVLSMKGKSDGAALTLGVSAIEVTLSK